jgi:hypothetical protein
MRKVKEFATHTVLPGPARCHPILTLNLRAKERHEEDLPPE